MQGKLRKKYIGALAAMTIARLEEVTDDLAQFLQTRLGASFVFLGPNARRNTLEEERDGCSAVFGLKCGLQALR